MARPWRCYNKSCGAPIGTNVRGELVLQNDDPNVQTINTEGAFLNVGCSACGRINRWIPRDSALIEAVMHMHSVEEFIAQVAMMWNRFKNQTSPTAEIDTQNTKEE